MLNITRKNLDEVFCNISEFMDKYTPDATATIYVTGEAALLRSVCWLDLADGIDVVLKSDTDLRNVLFDVSHNFALPKNISVLNTEFKYTSNYSPKLMNYVSETVKYSSNVVINYLDLKAVCASILNTNVLNFKQQLCVLFTVVEKDISLNDVDKIYKDLYNEELDANLLMTMVKASSIFKEYKRKFNVTNIRTEYERLVGVLGITDMHDLALEVAYTFLD